MRRVGSVKEGGGEEGRRGEEDPKFTKAPLIPADLLVIVFLSRDRVRIVSGSAYSIPPLSLSLPHSVFLRGHESPSPVIALLHTPYSPTVRCAPLQYVLIGLHSTFTMYICGSGRKPSLSQLLRRAGWEP